MTDVILIPFKQYHFPLGNPSFYLFSLIKAKMLMKKERILAFTACIFKLVV